MIAKRSAACFCTYDVRAIVTPDLFDAVTYQHLAQAFVTFAQGRLSSDMPITLAIGHDARLHSPLLFQALKSTLLDLGVNVIDVGLQPSPMVYAMEWLDLPEDLPSMTGTLTVTASHNPAPYNGLKWTLQGQALSREDVQSLKQIFKAQQSQAQQSEHLPLASSHASFQDLGHCVHFNPIPAYIDWMRRTHPRPKSSIKLVVDAGNATGGLVALPLLDAFGIEVVPLYTDVDGRFPNHHPDPSKAKNMADLIKIVQDTQADFGVAFDGDSDRLGVVDDQGRIISGDFLLLLMTQTLMHRMDNLTTTALAPKVVGEVKCSQHLFSGIEAAGATAIISPTGHAKIKHTMTQEQAVLGGELSGHFFFKDRHWGFDDAFYGMMRMVEVLDDARQRYHNPQLTLSHLVESLPKTIISDELRYALEASLHEPVLSHLKHAFQALQHEQKPFGNQAILNLSTLDGLRLNLDGGFALVRASNTEPVLSLRWEAANEEDLDANETKLLYLIHKAVQHAEAAAQDVSMY
jgi:phosphomannomutase/phosphoglucomutase